ncbi:hypothetical protein [Bacillus wiedmannii]|uniref:hypothetical protein n=1 Tax=Bacillus wiedmannii TaxID=1890302 RepID=UPI0021006616|nr:hypothetical protein [Bacillus wiedmannii]
MSIYNFLATDIELPILKSSNDNIKSFNDLLGLGYKEKELYRLFGGMLKGLELDKNEKIFLINGDAEEGHLLISADHQNQFARYYSKKKNIYMIENNNSKLLPQYVKEYLDSITVFYKDIELWHTWLDEYELEGVEYERTNVAQLTVGKLEFFFRWIYFCKT